MPSNISIREYFADASSGYNKDDAAIIGPILKEMTDAGGVSERDIVDHARSANSPLHRYFEWDNVKAADLYRMGQAGAMMRAIKVRFIENDKPRVAPVVKIAQPTREREWDSPRQSFKVLDGDTAFAAQMMDAAFEDLAAWKGKYSQYIGMWQKFADCFAALHNQIGEAEQEIDGTDGLAPSLDNALAALIIWRSDHEAAMNAAGVRHEQMGYIIEALNEAEKAFLGARVRQARSCLKCSSPFDSLHPGHRICGLCKPTVNAMA